MFRPNRLLVVVVYEPIHVPRCVCNLGFIVIELKLSYEPSALLRWRTLVSVDFPTRIGRRMHWILVLESGKVHAARI